MTFPPGHSKRTASLAAVAAFILVGCGDEVQPTADLVLVGGRLVTLSEDAERAPAEAEALAAVDGRVVFVGSDEEVSRWIGPDTEVLDLEGRLAVPGFIEGPRPLLGPRRVEAPVEPRVRVILGRDRRAGCRGGRGDRTGNLDPGPGLASVEVVGAAPFRACRDSRFMPT